MHRYSIAALCACLLVSFGILSTPAKAGEYYNGGYYRHPGNVWYSSNCCYRKVVRHERSVRYVAVEHERSYYPSSHYGYSSSYYARPYRHSYYADQPRRYVDDGYYGSRSYDSYASNCYRRKVQVLDGRGGWVWGSRSSCY